MATTRTARKKKTATSTGRNGTGPTAKLDLTLGGEEREFILINGTQYFLHNADDWPLHEYRRHGRIAKHIETLMELDRDLTPEEDQELSQSLDHLTHMALDAPEEIHASLTDIVRLKITRVFADLLRGEMPATAGATPPATPGSTLSLGSAASTAATP